MALDYIPIRSRYKEDWSLLSDEDVGQLVRAALVYLHSPSGGNPEFTGAARYFWPSFKRDLDAAFSQYEAKVEAGKSSSRNRSCRKKQCKDAQSGKREPYAGSGSSEQISADVNRPEHIPAEVNRPEHLSTEVNRSEQASTEASKANNNQYQYQNQYHSSSASAEEEKRWHEAAEAVVNLFYDLRPDVCRPPQTPAYILDKAAKIVSSYTMDAIKAVFEKSGTGFLNGGGTRGWQASLGWLLDDQNFQRVLAGEFDSTISTPDNTGRKETAAQIMTRRVKAGTAGLGEMEREAIAKMLAENGMEDVCHD